MIKRYSLIALFGIVVLAAQFSGVRAQIIVSGSVFIEQGTSIYTSQSVINEGIFVNNGHLQLASDWNNRGTYQGDGIMVLAGIKPQYIIHNGDPVNRAEINTTYPVKIHGRFPVDNSLIMTRGNILTTINDTLFIRATAAIQDGSINSYIQGPVHFEGTGYNFAPVGNKEQYLPVVFEDVTGISPHFSIQVKDNLPDNFTRDGLRKVDRDFYWQVSNYQGTYTGSALTVQMPDNNYNTDYLGLLYGKSPSSSETEFLNGLTSSSNGTITFNTTSIAGAGIFAVAEEVMPVSEQRAFYFPNTLSPTAVLEEDRSVKIFGALSPDDFRLVIFNRSGVIVFETTDLEYMQLRGWKGESKSGVALPGGSYPYLVETVTTDGRQIKQKGMISLVR